jgi:ribosome-binding protein aMBF1 (putative translation factor)
MNCVICGNKVEEANHIAITTEGDPVILCDDCYKKAEPFFKEVPYDVQEDS